MLPRARATARRLDPRTMTSSDWDSVVGNKTVPTQTFTAASQLPGGSNSQPGVVIPLKNVSWQIPPSGTGTGTPSGSGYFAFEDSTINYRFYVNHGTNVFVQMRNCTVDVPLLNMTPDQTNGGALDGTCMSLYGVDLKSKIDGCWPSDCLADGVGNASIVELCRITGPGHMTFQGYPLAPGNIAATTKGLAGTTGAYCSEAQLASVQALQPSTVYNTGDFVAHTGGGLYEVSTGGTSGSGTVSGHPWWQNWIGAVFGPSQTMFKDLPSNGVTQPFSDGPDTLQLVFIGSDMHADGTQVGRTGRVSFRRTKIGGFPNSCFFIQSSARSYDNSSNPAGPVSIINCDLQASKFLGINGQWIYTNTGATDPNYASGAWAGRWQRSSGGVWSAFASPWLGRPEGITIIDNLFRNRAGDGLSPQFTSTTGPLQDVPSPTTVGNGSGAPTTGDYPVFVRTEAERLAGIAKQWTTPPTNNVTDAGGVIDPTVLEARYQYGIFPGSCDARSWVVWNNNIDEAGAVINPKQRFSITGFDSQGYYTGI